MIGSAMGAATTHNSADAVVVGGGIAGTAVAYHLVREGHRTVQLDRGDRGRATDAAAGILCPSSSNYTASETWFRLATRAVEHYPLLAEELRRQGQRETSYSFKTLLAVATDPDEVEPFDQAKQRAVERGERLGAPRSDRVEAVAPDEARAMFPPLGSADRVLRYDEAARIDGRVFTDAMGRAAVGCGLDRRAADVTDLLVEDGRCTGVVADGVRWHADAVVLAGGAWTRRFAARLGVPVPVGPERGQIAHLCVREETADWPIVSAFHGHYLVPFPGGRVVVGATQEGGDPAPMTTAGGVREVLDEALRVAPGLREAELAEVRVGLRPTSADGLPILGEVPTAVGAYLATGFGAAGLQLGPYAGKLLADLVVGRPPETDLAPFSVDRFR